MIRFVCDTPDRIPARIFAALESKCPCCTFFRGVALGALVGASIAALIIAALLRG